MVFVYIDWEMNWCATQVTSTRCMRGARVCSSVDHRTRRLVSGTSEHPPLSTLFQVHLQVVTSVSPLNVLSLNFVVLMYFLGLSLLVWHHNGYLNQFCVKWFLQSSFLKQHCT